MACLHDGTDDINTQQLFRIHESGSHSVLPFSLCVCVFRCFYDDGTSNTYIICV